MDPASSLENAPGPPGGRQRRGVRFPHGFGRRTQRAAHRLHRPSSSAFTHTTTSRITRTRDDRDGRRLTDTRRFAPTSVHLRRNRRSRSPESVFNFNGIRTISAFNRPATFLSRGAPVVRRTCSQSRSVNFPLMLGCRFASSKRPRLPGNWFRGLSSALSHSASVRMRSDSARRSRPPQRPPTRCPGAPSRTQHTDRRGSRAGRPVACPLGGSSVGLSLAASVSPDPASPVETGLDSEGPNDA